MRPRIDALLAQILVVLECVDLLALGHEVTREAHRYLGNLAGFLHSVDGDLHLLNIVEAVKDAIHVHAGLRGGAHKLLHHVVGVGLVAHTVGSTQEHLEANVGDCLAQLGQSSEGILLQEAVGHVKGRSSPALQGEARVHVLAHLGCTLEHVEGAHARGRERLVRIAHGGVRQKHPRLGCLAHPLCHRLGTITLKDCLRVGLLLRRRAGHDLRGPGAALRAPALDEGVLALQDLLGHEAQELRGRRRRGLWCLLGLGRSLCQGLALRLGVLLELAHGAELGVALLDQVR
mmetsp:Transcript_67070/g.178640  ORF Transcript_67070/g.178640 Transcript_67070/m.178640 type:complete len:289 (+) Transcript_67070:1644-2510(+)